MEKILVIDDEPIVRTLIDVLLSRQGAHIMGFRMSQRPTKAKPLIEPLLLRMIPPAWDDRHPKGSFPPIKLLLAHPTMPWKQAEQSTEEVPPAMPHRPAAVY